MKENYIVNSLAENVWTIREKRVVAFLLVGNERALLIDSCSSPGEELPAIVRGLTDKPVDLVITHAESDHTGGKDGFDAPFLHPAEYENYVYKGNDDSNLRPVWEGDTFELGGMTIEVVHLPGHTPGCIALLDRGNRRIFTGDLISNYVVYMFGRGRNMKSYIESLRKLEGMMDSFDLIHPSHGWTTLDTQWVTDTRVTAEMLVAGKIEPREPTRTYAQPCKAYIYRDVKIYL